jgi:hypothetical protein
LWIVIPIFYKKYYLFCVLCLDSLYFELMRIGINTLDLWEGVWGW